MAARTTASATGIPAGIVRRPARPLPERSPLFAHLDLAALRARRFTLTAEESRVSYWRRLLRARIEVLTAGDEAASPDAAPVDGLTAHRVAMAGLGSLDGLPELPDLTALWADQPTAAGRVRRLPALTAAEGRLSDYRGALHAHLDAATRELIARYREDPAQCLVALPLGPRD
jgi:hypothetical protein